MSESEELMDRPPPDEAARLMRHRYEEMRSVFPDLSAEALATMVLASLVNDVANQLQDMRAALDRS
ncbi:MAG: hypothetical protein AAGF12_34380 [Myxococcota bacterium]